MMGKPISQLDYKTALRLIEGHRRLLQDAHSDAEVLRAYEAIVRFLYRLPPSQLDKLLGRKASGSSAIVELERRSAEVSNLPLDKVEESVFDSSTSRKMLEAIAIGRFKMPKGSMRSIGNIDQLRTLIINFIDNERAHESISEVAREGR